MNIPLRATSGRWILTYECCGESCDLQVAFGKLELGGCPGAQVGKVVRL